VINYLEIALEKPLDEDTKDVLRKSHSASQSLVYVIDDLLNLTNSQETNFAMLETAFDIKAGMAETLEPLRAHAQRKSLLFTNDFDPQGFPAFVKGDLQRFQQILSQVVSNAIRHTAEGHVSVKSKVASMNESYCLLETAIDDTGEGLSGDELDDIFQDLEQVSLDDHSDDVLVQITEAGDSLPLHRPRRRARLGLGLALVARFVLLRDGQLRIKSTKDKGTLVTLSLPWIICPESTHPFQSLASPLTPAGEVVPTPSEEDWSSNESPQGTSQTPKSMIGFFDRPVTKSNSLNPKTPLYAEGPALTPGSTNAPMVVAIADDNTINLQVLKRRLEIMGHKVFVSRDGQECFEVFQENSGNIQFVLMDLDVSEHQAYSYYFVDTLLDASGGWIRLCPTDSRKRKRQSY
jgi:CheY-like chemotaxis protein